MWLLTLVVEFAQRVRGNIQSTVYYYLVRIVAMILAALLVGFGLNRDDYGGSCIWSSTLSQRTLIFSLLCQMAIREVQVPAPVSATALWLKQELVIVLSPYVRDFCDHMRGFDC